MTTTAEVRKVLEEARIRLSYASSVFNDPRFTDRANAGPRIKSCASKLNELLVRTDWEVVPKESTVAMRRAGMRGYENGMRQALPEMDISCVASWIWAAMLAAAQQEKP